MPKDIESSPRKKSEDEQINEIQRQMEEEIRQENAAKGKAENKIPYDSKKDTHDMSEAREGIREAFKNPKPLSDKELNDQNFQMFSKGVDSINAGLDSHYDYVKKTISRYFKEG